MTSRLQVPRRTSDTAERGSTIVYAAPDALRAARSLLGLGQGQVAASVGVSRRLIAACESEAGGSLKNIATLRRFYEQAGMEFLGTVDLNTAKVHGSGACWKLRSLWCRLAGNLSRDDANFSAARALLGLEVRKVAQKAYLTPRQVTNLERGRSFTRKGYDSLREFFEESGVEFLSFRTSPLDYAGLGVRVGFSDALLPSGLWANRRATWRRADSAADSHVLE